MRGRRGRRGLRPHLHREGGLTRSTAAYRYGRPWTAEQVGEHLARLKRAPVNFASGSFGAMNAARGWATERAAWNIGWEPPGPPVEGGLFERVREAIADYSFSDPDIVEAHFDPAEPLLGRTMLLDIKVLGLHFASGVRVTEVEGEREHGSSRAGFRYDTLQGHIERGAEWFRVTKDHHTGEVRFCIESRWKRGDLPNWWSRLAFGPLAPRYRMLWMDRAAVRLRAATREGPPIELSALSRWSTVTVIGLLTGLRSTAGPTLVAGLELHTGAPARARRATRAWASPVAAASFAMAALIENIIDKHPRAPSRARAPALVARAISAATAAAMLCGHWRRPAGRAALLASVAATGSAIVATRLRAAVSKRFKIPTSWLGVVEDGLVAAGGAWLTRRSAAGAPQLRQFDPGPDVPRLSRASS